jgi:serine/threonine-protein kinase
VTDRIPNVTLQFSLGLVLYYAVHVLADKPGLRTQALTGLWLPPADTAAVLSVLVGLVLFGLARAGSPPRLLLWGFGVYEVVTCFLVSLFELSAAGVHGESLLGVPVAAMVIVVFPLVVPVSLRMGLVTGLLGALTVPLAYLLGEYVLRVGSLSWPDWWVMVGAMVISALLAGFPSRIVHEPQWRDQFSRLGSYRLTEVIGAGGMGEVWSAEHRLLQRPAAVKLVHAGTMRSAGQGQPALPPRYLLDRFRTEAEVIARLRSPHTIQLFDFGQSDTGTFYYVMELLEGMSLDDLVSRHGSLPPERCVYLLVQICRSLEEAHAAGLVHRDIKPGNIFVCHDAARPDHVKVLDFGLVALRTAEDPDDRISGTPPYTAPEVVTGRRVLDHRADLYSLGCVAFWMLTSRWVFEGRTAQEQFLAHVQQPAPLLSQHATWSIPDWLETLVRELLAKDPDRRPASATAVRHRLLEHACERHWDTDVAAKWWQERPPDRRPPVRTGGAFELTETWTQMDASHVLDQTAL